MTHHNEATLVETRIKLRWRERLILPMLIIGGLLTVSWIVVLIGLAWQISAAAAGMAMHP